MAEGVARVRGTPNDSLGPNLPDVNDTHSEIIDKMRGAKVDPIEMILGYMRNQKDEEDVRDFVQKIGGMSLSPDAFASLSPVVRQGFIAGMRNLPDERYQGLFPHSVQPSHSGNRYTGEDIQRILQPYEDHHRILLGLGQ